MKHIKYYFPGLSLITVALIIVAFPQILIAFIGATILCVGFVALYIGHMLRKGLFEAEYSNGSLLDEFLMAQPVFRRWYDRF
jgi:inner membrane protein involved in colicin E2 resistance